ncbi:MAG: hypothetical protein U0805_16575 [Pirellulales bacterium]
MSNANALWLRRCASILFGLAVCGCADGLFAQANQWQASQPRQLSPMAGAAAAPGMGNGGEQPPAGRRAPLARLIENPDQTEGAPPYALTDQTGTVQRYVEPVPGVNLAAHVGQIVAVRSDTGPTLLATQLDLPRETLYPMIGQMGGDPDTMMPARASLPRRPMRRYGVEQTQYVDDDDSTVQLLPEDVPMSGGTPQLEMLGHRGQFGAYPGPGMPEGLYGPGCDPQFCDPTQCGPGMMPPYGGGPMPFPQCDGCQDGYGNSSCEMQNTNSQQMCFYADVDFMFMRTRVSEDVVGKLSETYEFSPRFVLGVQNVGPASGRIRYWHYGRNTNVLGDGSVRFEFDVLDLEAVHYIGGKRSEVALAAGIRLANLELRDTADLKSYSDMIGLTMAADGLTKCHTFSSGGYIGWAYGGRLSLLGGDWGGDEDSLFIDRGVHDDNLLVTELYAGVEAGRRFGNFDFNARAVFEIQNWRSDVLAQNAALESVGFLGPGLQVEAAF